MASITNIQELLTKHNITDTAMVKDFLGLAGNRGASQNRPSNIVKDGVEYFYCRNSSHYFTIENMVKDKTGKSKGYSSIGNSIYTQAQNHKKGLLKKIDTLKDEFMSITPSDEQYDEKIQTIKDTILKYQSTIDDGKYADGLWMVDTFLTSLKPERVELFNKIAFTKDVLEAEEVKEIEEPKPKKGKK